MLIYTDTIFQTTTTTEPSQPPANSDDSNGQPSDDQPSNELEAECDLDDVEGSEAENGVIFWNFFSISRNIGKKEQKNFFVSNLHFFPIWNIFVISSWYEFISIHI